MRAGRSLVKSPIDEKKIQQPNEMGDMAIFERRCSTLQPISIRGHLYFTDVLDIMDCVSPSHVPVLDIIAGSP